MNRRTLRGVHWRVTSLLVMAFIVLGLANIALAARTLNKFPPDYRGNYQVVIKGTETGPRVPGSFKFRGKIKVRADGFTINVTRVDDNDARLIGAVGKMVVRKKKLSISKNGKTVIASGQGIFKVVKGNQTDKFKIKFSIRLQKNSSNILLTGTSSGRLEGNRNVRVTARMRGSKPR